MTKQTQQKQIEPLNADYLFLAPTEHFGLVGVGVGGGSKWIGMGRLEDGSGPSLVRLLKEKQTDKFERGVVEPNYLNGWSIG